MDAFLQKFLKIFLVDPPKFRMKFEENSRGISKTFQKDF